MAMTRERRTVKALLMVATQRLQTAKLACAAEEESDADVGKLMQSVVDAVEQAMAELKS